MVNTKERTDTTIILEARTARLLRDPRLDRYERFGTWIVAQGVILLPPGEIVVEVVDGDTLPPRRFKTKGNEAVGAFCVRLPDGYVDRWFCALALGAADEDDDEDDDECEQEARLTTLAHELLHVSEFWTLFGATPAIVAAHGDRRQLAAYQWRVEGDDVEDHAREITDLFLDYDREPMRSVALNP